MDELITSIKTLRSRLNESQQVFANRLGVSSRAVANYEAGRTPTRAVLFSLTMLAGKTKNTDLSKIFQEAYHATMRGLTKPTNDEEVAWVRMVLALLRNKDHVPELKDFGITLLAALERLSLSTKRGTPDAQEIEEAVSWARMQITPNAERQLMNLARERSQRTGEPFATSYAQVLIENPGLYKQYRNEELPLAGEIYDLIEEKTAQHPGMPYMVAHDEVRHENAELWERAGRELALRRVAGEKQEATRESESDEPAAITLPVTLREVISGDSARKNKKSVKK